MTENKDQEAPSREKILTKIKEVCARNAIELRTWSVTSEEEKRSDTAPETAIETWSVNSEEEKWRVKAGGWCEGKVLAGDIQKELEESLSQEFPNSNFDVSISLEPGP